MSILATVGEMVFQNDFNFKLLLIPFRGRRCTRTFLVHFLLDSAIDGLSYGRFKVIRYKFHCQLLSNEPLVIGRRVWIRRSLNQKPC
jgi:hypothetical protein